MPAIPTDMLGYDRAITVFSPDGRLLQVEYARETVRKGATVIGIIGKKSVVLMAEKIVSSDLMVSESIQKVYQIDSHVAGAGAGLLGDARVLIKKAQEEARRHQLIYDEPIEISTLVSNICDFKQLYTQYGGIRPFGVSLLVGGVDSKGPRLFLTEPAGIFFEYKAVSIGEGSNIVNKYLEKNYKEGMSDEEAINLAIKALKSYLKTKFDENKVEIVQLDGEFKKYTPQEIAKHIKNDK
ncbi:MAG TPA: archaeal proteasome endopeptidase complex subunit alpha [Candidatus Nanoarchaeia archaeon]|nr:archaeal proteasome endopeptidase complex subunit alpha [Candidatus Nanoarchaeia archaeon]